MRVQTYEIDQDTGTRGPLHWEGEFDAEVIEDDAERAEIEAKLRASGEAYVGGGAMPLVLIVRVGG